MNYEELKIKLKQLDLTGIEFGILIGGSKRTVSEYARIGVPVQVAIIVDQMINRLKNGEDRDAVIASVSEIVTNHLLSERPKRN
jgi:hypothetical protein